MERRPRRGTVFQRRDYHRTYIVSALGQADGVEIVRATTQIDGEEVMRVFPASEVVDNLVYDEEIVLRPVAFA